MRVKFREKVQKNAEISCIGLTEFSTTTISYVLMEAAATVISAKRGVLRQ